MKRVFIITGFLGLLLFGAHSEQLSSASELETRNSNQLHIEQLRAKGIASVFEFYEKHKSLLSSPAAQSQSAARHAHEVFDAICQQKDCYASKLFWHTDLERAKEIAKKKKKPILSLHLLGKLTDEYSCANSRFFRALLYPDPRVSKMLREDFVLHWKTVREVPQVRIQFHDGKTLRNTVTGNSIHYILTAEGQVVDAIPGLYDPAKFVELLEAAHPVARLTNLSRRKMQAEIRKYHIHRLNSLSKLWRENKEVYDFYPIVLGKPVGLRYAKLPSNPPSVANPNSQFPSAFSAGTRSLSKMMPERPVLDVASSGPNPYKALEDAQQDLMWFKLATLPGNRVSVSRAAKKLIRHHLGNDQTNTNAAIVAFERTVAIDTLRNEFQLHKQIHSWLASGTSLGLDELNEKIYNELFLTPQQDEWIGLNPSLAYRGLENNGVQYEQRSKSKADDTKA